MNFERNERRLRWYRNPLTNTIHLLNGATIEAHVNGKSIDGSTGWIFGNGREMPVRLIDGQWYEQESEERNG